MTVTIALLNTILAHYPTVPSHLIHSAGMEACVSGTQRLRDLHKKHGVIYSFSKKDMEYTFETSKEDLRVILKSLSHGRGGVGTGQINSMESLAAPARPTTNGRLF